MFFCGRIRLIFNVDKILQRLNNKEKINSLMHLKNNEFYGKI